VKRAEQKATTRAALIDAAVDEFASYGYRGARIERIAERAGVTTGALYTHFASKDALYVAVYETTTSRQSEEIALLARAGSGTSSRDEAAGLAGALDVWLAGQLADPRWLRLNAEFLLTHAELPALPIDVIHARRELRQQVARWLTSLAEATGRQLVVPADELALQALALINGTVIEHITDPETYVEGRFGRSLVRLFTASTEAARSRDATDRPHRT
jgi:AcrR family transcriptional regulator